MNNVAKADCTSAPQNYEDMHRIYFPFIVNLCAILGIDENSKEDVASDIFLRLMERSFLDQYDPTLVFEFNGQLRPARFKTFLSSVVSTYVRGHYDKQMRIRRREKLIIDKPIGSDGRPAGTKGAEKWLDNNIEPESDPSDAVLEKIMEEDNADAVRAFLADIPARSVHDRCDLVALFDAVRAQILEFGVYDIKKLTTVFGVGSTAMNNWMWWLKENLAEIYGLPVPPRRPRSLKAV